MALRVSVAARNAQLNALAALLNNGYLRIYSGSQPVTPESSATGTLLAELRFGSTAFNGAVSGVITANPISSDLVADATGGAGYFRCLQADGTTAVYDGSVGTSGAELNLNSTAIQANAQVDVTALSISL